MVSHMREKNRKKRGVIAVSTSAILATFATMTLNVVLAEPANAWNALYCRYVGSNAKVFVAVNNPSTPFAAAGDEWEVGTSGIAVNNTSAAGDRNVYAYSDFYGPTGWSGILDHVDDVGGNAPPCMATGHWNYTKIAALVNNTYLSNDAQRKMVAVHEFGHFLGLGHNNATTPCPTTGSKVISVMYFSDARAQGDCPVSTPQADDRNGINVLY